MFITKISGARIPQKELVGREPLEQDFKMLEDFQKQEVDFLPQKQIWGMYSAEYLKSAVDNGSIIKMYYDNDNLVCWLFLIVNDKHEFDKHEANDYKFEATAIYGGVMVAPEYFGNGLQKQMTKELENIAKEKGCKYMIGTVAPNNNYSYNNLIDLGYKVIGEKQKSKGHRYIISKQLN